MRLPGLGQWIPRFPSYPVQARRQPHDPVATDLARRIETAQDAVNRLWAERENAWNAHEEMKATRVGLAPALFEEPVLHMDPGMIQTYYDYVAVDERYDRAERDLSLLRVALMERIRRNMAALRPRMALSRLRLGPGFRLY